MPLKLKYDKKEDIPKGLEDAYTEKEGIWVLDVDGMVPSAELTDLKTKISEFRDNNVSLQTKISDLEKRKFLTDEEKTLFEELKAQKDKLDEKVLLDEGKIEELLQKRTETMRKDHESMVEALNKKLTASETIATKFRDKLNGTLVESSITKAISDVGIPVKGALADILSRARSTFIVSDELKLEAKRADGSIIFGGDGTTPLGVEEFAKNLVKDAPFLFESSTGAGGGGGTPPKTGADGKIQIPRSASNFNELKSKYIDKIASGEAVVVD